MSPAALRKLLEERDRFWRALHTISKYMPPRELQTKRGRVVTHHTTEYTKKLPTEVGLYRHRWDFFGQMREQVLFVGYTNARAPRLQGSEPNAYMPRKLKCCKPDEHLHADRLSPKEWGGWWARIETPNDGLGEEGR